VIQFSKNQVNKVMHRLSNTLGAEEGTRDMTFHQIEEGADKGRAEGGVTHQILAEGRETWLIVARAGALDSGAPRDASGQPTNKAILDWGLMGAKEGTRDMTWEQIEEGAAKVQGKGGSTCKTAASRKRKSEGGIRSGNARKAACLAMAQDDRHSHACILPECAKLCTPEPPRTSRTRTDLIRHLCRVYQKQICGLNKHMCRQCHRMAAQCRAAVCTHVACSRPHKFCEHLHAQEDTMKTSPTEASALQAAGSSPPDSP